MSDVGGDVVRALNVLVVEDNAADAYIIEDTLKSSPRPIHTTVVVDGAQALAFLSQEPPFQSRDEPQLILLDLNLPKLDGSQVLAAIRSDDSLKHIPVIILTSSEDETDISRSYRLGANCYVTKPLRLAAYRDILHAVESFWGDVVHLPRAGPWTS